MASSLKDIHDKPVEYINGKVSVKTLLPEAAFPSKEEGKGNDVGYGVSLVQRSENRSEDTTHEVNNFRTGIVLSPPNGYYVEVIATSSLHKHGYFLATGTSVINPGNSSELIVPLYKYKEVSDIELPFRAVQIIVKPAVYSYISSVKNLPSSSRGGDGMFLQSFEPSGRGTYIQDPQNASYPGDMQEYQNQTQSYGRGQLRPQSASRSSNHMF